MKKFARCVLILILVTIISGVGGYFYENKTLTTMYTSTTQLYVVPGEENEATIRADNGGLKDDFVIIFKSGVVIQEAQKIAGTSENIAQYLTVSSPANSNIVEITCTNPDQNTAKLYVDAVARTALKTTSIIPVKSIQILSEGTADNVPVKPDLYRNTFIIAALGAGICLAIETVIMLLICAFRKPEDNSDDESEYEKYYGKYAALNAQEQMYISLDNGESGHEVYEEKKPQEKSEKLQKQHEDMQNVLDNFDEDYDNDEDFYNNQSESQDNEVERNIEEQAVQAESENKETLVSDETINSVFPESEDKTEIEDNMEAQDIAETKVVEQSQAVMEFKTVEETDNQAEAEAAVSEEFEISEETVHYEEEAEEITDIIEEAAREEEEFKEAPKKSSVQILGIIKK